MKVALLFNERPAGISSVPDDMFEEYDSLETIREIAHALCGLRVEVEPVVADRRLPWRLEEGRYDFAFNIAEGPLTLSGQARRCREAIPAAVCELLSVPYTGSDALTLTVTLDKAMARRVASAEVSVSRAVLLQSEADEHQIADLQFPAIVKPNDEGSSKGIRKCSFASDASEAVERARQLMTFYRCPVLVEEFLPGPEVTVAVAGNLPDARVLGMMEIAPADDSRPFIYSLEVRRDWRRRVVYHIPPRLDASTQDCLRSSALAAYRLLGCRDLARMDFRLDSRGRPCFLECNALPGLNPEYGDVAILSRKTLPYEKLVQGVLVDAARRTGVRLP